jgi:hypothetical protein
MYGSHMQMSQHSKQAVTLAAQSPSLPSRFLENEDVAALQRLATRDEDGM